MVPVVSLETSVVVTSSVVVWVAAMAFWAAASCDLQLSYSAL